MKIKKFILKLNRILFIHFHKMVICSFFVRHTNRDREMKRTTGFDT